MEPALEDLDVIAPNLNRRQSGVSATVFSLVPLQNKQLKVSVTGVGIPRDLPRIALWRIPFLSRRTRIWHARRNNEMIVGILLKYIFRSKLKLIFTSSSPRKRGALTRWLVARMDAIVATTKINATVMPGSPTVIPHGVDTNGFQPGESDLFNSNGQKLIGCFGRIRPMKGTHRFVDAVSQLLPQHPEYSAIIMGRITQQHEEYAEELKARISQANLSDRILFMPEQPIANMAAAYQALSIYSAPSLLEGFGLTPLEAMACGIPTVASKGVGAFNDQIRDGETGYLVEKDNADALAAALSKLMSDDRHLSAAKISAREHVLADFSLEKEAEALVELYNQLLAEDQKS